MSETTRPGFIRIDNRIITDYAPRVGAHALAVYVALALHAHNTTRQCYPSTRRIARLLHLSQPTVLKAIATLEEVGLINVERPATKRDKRRVNVYTLPAIGGDKGALAPALNDVEHGAKGALAEQDLINKTQKNYGESATGGPMRPARPPAPDRDRNLDHPAVAAYREAFSLTPDPFQRAEIARVVADVASWREVLRNWRLAGYSKRNIPGMIDRYRRELNEEDGGDGRNAGSGQFGFARDGRARRATGGGETPEEAARRDVEWQSYELGSQRSNDGGSS